MKNPLRPILDGIAVPAFWGTRQLVAVLGDVARLVPWLNFQYRTLLAELREALESAGCIDLPEDE